MTFVQKHLDLIRVWCWQSWHASHAKLLLVHVWIPINVGPIYRQMYGIHIQYQFCTYPTSIQNVISFKHWYLMSITRWKNPCTPKSLFSLITSYYNFVTRIEFIRHRGSCISYIHLKFGCLINIILSNKMYHYRKVIRFVTLPWNDSFGLFLASYGNHNLVNPMYFESSHFESPWNFSQFF